MDPNYEPPNYGANTTADENMDIETNIVVATEVVTAEVVDLTPIALNAPPFSQHPYVEHMSELYPAQGGSVLPSQLNCFSGMVGQAYWHFLSTHTTWVNDFTNYWLQSYDLYSWLTPYTGNAHNRAFFTQLVLHLVGKAKHGHNQTHLPNLYEPFIGSGQVFMGAEVFADPLLEPAPFGKLVAGDLNPFLIAAYRAMKTTPDLVHRYVEFARALDDQLEEDRSVYRAVLDEVNAFAKTGANNLAIGMRYIWLVNRCTRGTTVSGGNLHATVNPKLSLTSLRYGEPRILDRVMRLVCDPKRIFIYNDFAKTTGTATASDVVFLDCPFPVFDERIPTSTALTSKPSNVYGLDGEASLQQRIITDAVRLAGQGTTVLICNFANPDLVLAYTKILTNLGIQNPRDLIYTYKSPGNESSVYQLVIVPGAGVNMAVLPALIRTLAQQLTHDDNFL